MSAVNFYHPLDHVLQQEALSLPHADTNPPNQFPSFLQNNAVQFQIDTCECNPLEFHVGSMLNQSTYQSPNTMSLSCKDINDYRKRMNAGQINNRYVFNCTPQFGNQHDDPMGLVYNPMYPIYNKIMPIPNSFYGGLENPIG